MTADRIHTEQQHRHTDADVEQLAATVRARISWPISAGEAGTIVTVVLDALAADGRLTNGRPTPHLNTVKAELDRARASLTEALNQRQQLINTLVEVLAHFREHGHPGEPCLRTGWIKTGAVEQWHEVLASLKAIDVTPLLPQPVLGSPADRAQDAKPCRGCFACSTAPDCQTEREG